MEFFLKSVTAPRHITDNYLHFALVSMEMIIFDNFQSKPHLNNSALVFDQTVCFDSLERSYSTCKMYRQRRKCSMETCHRSSMAPVQTEGQEIK